MKKLLHLTLFLFIMLFISGCGINYNAISPNFAQEYMAKNRIIIVPPTVQMYEIGVGQTKQEMNSWSMVATQNLKRSLYKFVPMYVYKQYEFIDYSNLPKKEKTAILNTNNLMKRVTASILNHGHKTSYDLFYEKMANFDYGVGDALAKYSKNGDLYLFINAKDNPRSTGKGFSDVALAILTAPALLSVDSEDESGKTHASLTLVDAKTGKIIWYNHYDQKGLVDLRLQKGTDVVAKYLLSGLDEVMVYAFGSHR